MASSLPCILAKAGKGVNISFLPLWEQEAAQDGLIYHPLLGLWRGSMDGLLSRMHSSESKKGSKGWLPHRGGARGSTGWPHSHSSSELWRGSRGGLLALMYSKGLERTKSVVSSLPCILARARMELKAGFPLLAVEWARS